MRIQRLTLDLFGQFADKSYDFGAGPQDSDFHVIYGPNEAGKTTTMEGFLRLLYGFPARDPYSFLHQRKYLRISAVIEAAGATQALTRLPVRVGDLVDENGVALHETAISQHLTGLSIEGYRNLLCLDDATIEKGGAEIANSKGETGRLLFSAAAGVSDLSDVLAHVDEQAGEIYRKGGTKSEIAGLKKELADVDAAIRAGDLSVAAFRKLRGAHEAAVQAETEARRERDALMVAQAQTAARLRALPALDDIDGLENAIAPFAAYPAQLDFDPVALVPMVNRHVRADADQARLTGEIAALENRLAGLCVPDQAATLTEALADLDPLRSRYVTAKQDLPRRRQGVVEIEENMARVAAQLGASDPADGVSSTAEIATLDAARDGWRQAHEAQVQAKTEAARAAAGLVELTDTAAGQAAHPSAGIAVVLDRFAADHLAVRHATGQAEIATARTHAQAALAALQWGGQMFAAIPECGVTAAAARDLAARDAEWAQVIAQAGQNATELDEGSAVRRAQMAQMVSDLGVIDDATAAAEIAARDALWQTHRGEFSAASADAFEAAMRKVDQSGAVRVAQASGLADLRHAAQTVVADETRLTQARARIAAAETARADIAAEVTKAGAAAGITHPMLAADFAEWCTAREAALAAAIAVDAKVQEHSQVTEKAEGLRAALTGFVDLDRAEFADLVNAARKLAEDERKQAAAQTAQQVAVAAQRRTAGQRETALETATAQAAEAKTAWEDAVRAAFSGRIDAAQLAGSLEPVRQLLTLDTKRREDAHRITAMEADGAAFVAQVAVLAAAQNVAAVDPLARFAALVAVDTTSRAAVAQRAAMQTELAAKRVELDAALRILETVAAERAVMAQCFPDTAHTTQLEDLRTTVAQAVDVIAARARKTKAEQAVCRDLSVGDMAAARSVLGAVSMPELEADAARISADLAAIDTGLSDAISARASAKQALDAVTGDDDIARLVERKTTLELEIEDAARRYLELRIGHAVAEEAIRRYRDTHRGGMMEATERAFVQLTRGAYRRLLTQREPGGKEMLLAMDAEGATKGAEGMSKGTRFQLYLALRAAAYEQMVEQGVVLPFFCDDIFETFDEDRTRAACDVMAGIGQQGQAIYLTHHAHVVDIARETCGDRVRVHRI